MPPRQDWFDRMTPDPTLPTPGPAAIHRQRVLRAVPARKCTIQGVSPESRNRVVAQAFGQRRGESSVEFSFSEKSFDGGSGGHN